MPRAEREQQILDVAGTVFARDGYHGAAMDEIAAVADISKPMLYQYFGSKEGLYVAYIERAGQELISRLERMFTGGEREPLALRRRVGEFLAFVDEHRDGWRVLWGEANASRPVADQTAELRSQITAAVRRLIPAEMLDEPAAHAAANAIVGAGESLANWWLTGAEVPREQVADWYADTIRATVLAFAGSAGEPIKRGP